MVGLKMGSSFKKAIFEEHVQEHILGWVNHARIRSSQRASSLGRSSSADADESPNMDIQMLQLLSSSRRVDSTGRREI